MRKLTPFNLADFIVDTLTVCKALLLLVVILILCGIGAGIATFVITLFMPLSPDQIQFTAFAAYIICMCIVVYVAE